jgi:dolichol kinase
LALFFVLVLWIVGLSSFLPAPVLVILCAALGSGVAATLWFAIKRRRAPHG